MASYKDLLDIQQQMEDRIVTLRETFGVLEGDFTHLRDDEGIFSLELDQGADNLLRSTLRDDLSRISQLVLEVETKFEPATQCFRDLLNLVDESTGKLESGMGQYREKHYQLQTGMADFDQQVGQSRSEFENQGQVVVAQVESLANELESHAQTVFSTSENLTQTIRGAQTQTLEEASEAFTSLLSTHIDAMLPGQFQQSLAQLQQGVLGLGAACSGAGAAFQEQLEALLQHVKEFAMQEVRNKVEEKFQKLIEEALVFLAREVTESVAQTTIGASVTGAMTPILPQLAALKAATGAIKEAIELWRKVKESTGGVL